MMVEEAQEYLDFERRLKELEDNLQDLDAFGLQEQILKLDKRLLNLERQIALGQINRLDQLVMQTLHLEDHAPIPERVDKCHARIQTTLGIIRGKVANSDTPDKELEGIGGEINRLLIGFGFQPIDRHSPYQTAGIQETRHP